MEEPISLDVLDPPDVEQTQFGPDMKRWLANIVDIINASFSSLSNYTANLITASGVDVGGGGAGPINVPVIGLTTNGFVSVNLISSSNPATITVVTVNNGSFDITFNADPGASAIIVYQAFTQQP